MSIWDTLQGAMQNARARLRTVFGRGAGKDPSAVRQEILNQVESRILFDASGKSFPFGKILVRLQPQTRDQRNALEAALLGKRPLKSDILQMLNEAKTRFSGDLEVCVEFREHSNLDPTEFSLHLPLELDFVKLNARHKQDVPETKVVVIKGLTEQPKYQMKKDRILIGRAPEVLDREGRMVRKNDIVFLENEEEINCSVGRAHARIWFDYEKSRFCILDEASRYGTRILRGGTVIEVPGADSNGIPVQSGDDIYCGQACLRFELI